VWNPSGSVVGRQPGTALQDADAAMYTWRPTTSCVGPLLCTAQSPFHILLACCQKIGTSRQSGPPEPAAKGSSDQEPVGSRRQVPVSSQWSIVGSSEEERLEPSSQAGIATRNRVGGTELQLRPAMYIYLATGDAGHQGHEGWQVKRWQWQGRRSHAARLATLPAVLDVRRGGEEQGGSRDGYAGRGGGRDCMWVRSRSETMPRTASGVPMLTAAVEDKRRLDGFWAAGRNTEHAGATSAGRCASSRSAMHRGY
jgi:hypothetical protein